MHGIHTLAKNKSKIGRAHFSDILPPYVFFFYMASDTDDRGKALAFAR